MPDPLVLTDQGIPLSLERVEVPAHALSHPRRYRGCMIPLDLLFALTPSILLAALWLADRIRGS